MQKIQRVCAIAMMVTAFAACGTDPLSPDATSGRPSYLMVGDQASASDVAGLSSTINFTATGCTTSTAPSEPTISGSSTYIVAYGEPTLCAAPTPPMTFTPVPVTTAPDSSTLKLSFY